MKHNNRRSVFAYSAVVFLLSIFSLAGSGPVKKQESNSCSPVIPVPLTVGIDDVGWKQGWSTDVALDRNKPSHIDGPEGRWMGIADYRAIVEIARAANTRLLCLFVMSEYDRSNICAEYPTTTERGEQWDNSALVSDDDFKVMDYVKANAAHMEFGLHGVRHEHWEDGRVTFAEFAGGNYNRRPYPVEVVEKHLECYKRLIDQYDISFPKSFVPPKHCYYYNPDDPMDTGGLVAKWGVKYVSWGHKYWGNYDQRAVNPLSNCTFDHGVLVLERDQSVPWYDTLGQAPEAISTDFYYECTHWHNFIAASPEDNPSVGEKWINWFNLIKDSPNRYLPRNTAQMYSQALYLEHAAIETDGYKLIIDNTAMPDWAYDKELVGSLVIKVPLAPGQHISWVSFDNGQPVAACYEDRGFGYVALPKLKKKKYEVQIKTGPEHLSNCVVNNGTYEVQEMDIEPGKVSVALEMYGTQDVHVSLHSGKPSTIRSSSSDLVVNSWKWDEKDSLCVINVTAKDIQGVRGELVMQTSPQASPLKVMRLGVNNWEFWRRYSDGEFSGVDVDIWREIADRNNLDIEYVPIPGLNALKPAMEKPSIDVFVSLLRTPEREEWMHFIEPPILTKLKFTTYVRAGSDTLINSYEDLADKTIALVGGHYGRIDSDPAIKIDDCGRNVAGAFEKLRSGSVDAVHINQWMANWFFRGGNNSDLYKLTGYTYKEYHPGFMVMSPQSLFANSWKERLGATIREMIDDGTMKRIVDGYVPGWYEIYELFP